MSGDVAFFYCPYIPTFMTTFTYTDKFGSEITLGDWVLYVPIAPVGISAKALPRCIMHGQIERLSYGSELIKTQFMDIVDSDYVGDARQCVKLTLEDLTMRKLTAGL